MTSKRGNSNAAGHAFRIARWQCAAMLACCGMAVGCSGNNLGAEVSGTAKLDGQPVGPGVVIFAPASGTQNPATGAIQTDGTYFLKTSREEGLPPGKYRVALQINEIPTDLAPGQRDMRPAKSRIPERYMTVDTSGLEFDVEPGANTIDIDMTSG